ncbi:ParB/sulfiredoxin domain protein [Psychrobacter phage vB_PmaS_Y8A]|nr:ParB/sulfiredoxin domain protein [Psychrobacter phage vB_PmaS_Y8A]
MSDLKIEYKNTDSLIPYVNNSRTHSDEQVTQVASSIKEFGFTNPILIDEQGGIIAGHGRLMAANKLGLEQVPTITLAGLTEAQRKAYVIADNQLALNSGWDLDMLRVEFERLEELDFDLSLIGFEDDVIEKLLDIDAEMPELPDGDRDPFQQKTFVLHDEQAQLIDDAITKARTNPLIDTGLNENSNGNAIAYICEQWLKDNG